MIYDEQNINILDEDRIQLYACTTWSHPIPALPHPNCCFLGSLGKKIDGICFTVSSPGLFLQGQEGYQTSRFNNASIKFTERNVFYFANVIYFRICSYWQFYYLYLCSKGAVSLQCGKAVLRGICTCASPPPTKAIPPALPPPTPKCTHT